MEVVIICENFSLVSSFVLLSMAKKYAKVNNARAVGTFCAN